MDLGLNGKVALVTGSSRGIGRAIALGLAEEGCSVSLCARGAEKLHRTETEVRAHGVQTVATTVDMMQADAAQQVVQNTLDALGPIDILINNAGMSPLYDKLSEVPEALFDKVIDVNLKGPFRVMAYAGERMAESGGGSIINISSTASMYPSPNAAAYGAAKAGLNSLTQSFAHALGPGVRVNCIVAGPFLTDISKAWDLEAFEASQEGNRAIPRGGDPKEIVGAALYFASPSSSFTTGTLLTVDGGGRG